MLLIGGEILAALRQKIHSRYRPNLRGHLSAQIESCRKFFISHSIKRYFIRLLIYRIGLPRPRAIAVVVAMMAAKIIATPWI